MGRLFGERADPPVLDWKPGESMTLEEFRSMVK
jgi:hypothetical protein